MLLSRYNVEIMIRILGKGSVCIIGNKWYSSYKHNKPSLPTRKVFRCEGIPVNTNYLPFVLVWIPYSGHLIMSLWVRLDLLLLEDCIWGLSIHESSLTKSGGTHATSVNKDVKWSLQHPWCQPAILQTPEPSFFFHSITQKRYNTKSYVNCADFAAFRAIS